MKIHSIVSVITNSSTELFIVPPGRDIEEVKEIIKNIIHFQAELEKRETILDPFSIKEFSSNSDDKEFARQAEWYLEYYNLKIKNGSVCITVEDNDVDYDILVMIERVLDAKRIHMG